MQRADEAFAAHWNMHRHYHGHDAQFHDHHRSSSGPAPQPSDEVLEQLQRIRDEARATAHESGIAMIEPCAWGSSSSGEEEDDTDDDDDTAPAAAVGAW